MPKTAPSQKRAQESYFQFKKTITNKEQLEMIELLSKDWMVNKSDVLFQLIKEGLTRERNKRREVDTLRTIRG